MILNSKGLADLRKNKCVFRMLLEGILIQKLYLLSFIFIFLLFFPTHGSSETPVEVYAVNHWSMDDTTRIFISTSGNVEFSKGRLSNPERLFFDIKNARLLRDIQTNYAVNDKIVKSVRMGQFNTDTVRIVIDLTSPDYDFKTFLLEDPFRFCIVLWHKKTSTSKDDSFLPVFIHRRVVIDAGHGGHDPGAVGPSGLYEKDVVLDIALKVKDFIQREYPLYEVMLTRDKDIFIPLDKRAEIANKVNADLFVSIHANASYNRYARGMETYILNWTDDEEAMRVAARENAISLKKMKQVQDELSIILTSLERESKRDESVKLAGYIQNSMTSAIKHKYPDVYDRGVKQALFFVLVGAKMPSALVEVGFISNHEEERLLANEIFRQKIADSIARGIHNYFAFLPFQKSAFIENKDYKAIQVKQAHRADSQ